MEAWAMDVKFSISDWRSNYRKVENSPVVSWLRTKLSLILTRSMLISLRGSRTLTKCEYALDDIEIAEKMLGNKH